MTKTEEYLMNTLVTIKDMHGCDLIALIESNVITSDELLMLHASRKELYSILEN